MFYSDALSTFSSHNNITVVIAVTAHVKIFSSSSRVEIFVLYEKSGKHATIK